jgi:choline kinase
MKAVILAAGKGTRLEHLTDCRPKCLIPVCGKPIIDHQICALRKTGITDIILVVGHFSDMIESHLQDQCTVVVNEEYERTNSIYSLWLARGEVMSQDFVLLNGDLTIDDSLLCDFVESRHGTATLVDRTKQLRDGEMNVIIHDERVVRISKEIPADEADAESAQVTKFSALDSLLLFDRIQQLISSGQIDLFPASAYDAVIEESRMYAVGTNGQFWFEIDTLDDLERCELARSRLEHS